MERTLGSEHPDTLSSLNNLAILLKYKGDLAGAEPLLRRVIEARERTLGPEHPDTLRSLNNLANLLKDKGDLDE
jgi:Flp pilus assembly protein TadD